MLSISRNKAQVTQINFVDAIKALSPTLAPSNNAMDFKYRSKTEVEYKNKNYSEKKLSLEEQSYPTHIKQNNLDNND